MDPVGKSLYSEAFNQFPVDSQQFIQIESSSTQQKVIPVAKQVLDSPEEKASAQLPFIEESREKSLSPKSLAAKLLSLEGTLNREYLDYVIKILGRKKPLSGSEQEIFHALCDIQKDPSILEKIQNFPIPPRGSALDKAMHISLDLSFDEPLSHQDIKKACLAALLGWWRQGGKLNNCFAVSFTLFVKSKSLHFLLDDLKEIAEKEFVSRNIGGTFFEFPALFRLALSRPYGKASCQDAVLALWENALGSMWFPPLCAPVYVTKQRAQFSQSLIGFFSWMAKTANLTSCLQKLQEVQINDSTPLTAEEQRDLSRVMQELGVSDDKKSDAKFFVLNRSRRSFQADSLPFKCFDRLRIAYAPALAGDSPDELFYNPVFIVCEKKEKGIFPVSAKGFVPLLVRMFYSLAESCDEMITENVESMFTDHQLVEDKLKEFFSKELVMREKEIFFKCTIGDFPNPDFSPQEVYFGQRVLQQQIQFTGDREEVLRVLKTAQDFLEPFGHESSLLASSSTHCFRLIPKYPLKSLELYEQQGKALLDCPLSDFPHMEKHIKKALKIIFADKPDVDMDAIYQNGAKMESLDVAVLLWKGDIFCNVSQEKRLDKMYDILHLKLLGVLLRDAPTYADALLPFGDTNYVVLSDEIPQKVHECFWFNPFEDAWRIAQAPEKGKVLQFDDMKYITVEVPSRLSTDPALAK